MDVCVLIPLPSTKTAPFVPSGPPILSRNLNNNMKRTTLALLASGFLLAGPLLGNESTGLGQLGNLPPGIDEAGPLHARDETRDICRLLGGRSDREFTGRPGNLYAAFGAKSRIIWMAGTLKTRSSFFEGAVLEWRPDYVQLQPSAPMGVDGQPVPGVAVEKYCWIGPRDSLWVEHLFTNTSAAGRVVPLSFDLQEVAELKSLDGIVTCKMWAGNREVFGAVSASHPLTFSDGKLRMEVSVPAGKSVSCVVSLAIGADAGKLGRAARPSADSRAESTRYWNRMLTREVPSFDCSDPYLEKLYYFRWWSLLTKLNVGGYGRWSKPLAREGTSEFNSLINYSGAPSTLDLRWMRSPEWAYGNVQSLYGNLHEGKLANHIWPDKLDGDRANYAPALNGTPTDFPYHNFLVKALADIYALHPDKAVLRELWPSLQQATAFYDRELDADHDGLYETYPWSNITGHEWAARFLYFHPFDRLLKYDRTWVPKDDAEAATIADLIEKSVVMRPGMQIPRTAAAMLQLVDQDRTYRQESVDENCYAYVDMKAMADIAGILGEKDARERWLAAAEKTRLQVLARLWDPATGFFYDRDFATKEWARVKSPTGFYPFWAGIGEKDQLPIFKHLFNSAEFWTPFPVPSISMDYPKLAELRKCGWTYWNWYNWPMTTCHVADAVARAAKEFDPSLRSGAAELLLKYTKVHFIEGDLKRPCVSELFDPINGKPNRPTLDYAHSYYIDLILRHVVGIEADPLSEDVRIDPLDLGLERFEARHLWVKGHELTVTWKPGEFAVSVDGRGAATAPRLTPLKVRLGASLSSARRFPAVPGVVIDHVPARTKTYIGSPALAILSDGTYVASHDFFDPGSAETKIGLTDIFSSADRGATWKKLGRVDGAFWSNLFVHKDALYLMGTTKEYGPLVIRRSTDGGRSWTSPLDAKSGLLAEGEFHTAPMPMLAHGGKLWRAIEDASGGKDWGKRFMAMMASVPVDADLLNRTNWTFSNALPSAPAWLNGNLTGWLEGNAVATADGRVLNILRVDAVPFQKAAVISIGADGTTAMFDPKEGFIDLPGGATKFTIRRDPASERAGAKPVWWALANAVPTDLDVQTNKSKVRNTLMLLRSENLKVWERRSIVLQHPDSKKHAFQYVDWLFDGDDIVAVSRTAFDDDEGGAENFHNANYLTFHRFSGFRALSLADAVPLSRSPITNGAEWKNGKPVGLPDAKHPVVERVFIYQPTTQWTFSHHPSLTFFKGRFYAIWSNAQQDEDAPGQRVLMSSSADFKNWPPPHPLVDSVKDEQGVERVLTAAGFHQHDGTLVAYFGNYGPNRETTHLQAVTTTDGEHWSPVREVGLPVNPNHGPQATASGRLIIAGNIAFPWTDDPAGLTGWHMTGIYPADLAPTIKDDPASFWEVANKQGWKAALCEGSFYQTDDGVLQMLLRNTGPQHRQRLWLTQSRDNGANWSAPVETDFSDTDTKFHFGRLPDGRIYYVGSPIGKGRTPLVLSVSRDGVIFDRHFILGDTHYERRRSGRYKDGEYGYPHTMIHDGFLYVIVSRQKEAVEVLRVALGNL